MSYNTSTGAVRAQRYTPYGAPRGPASTLPTDYRFTGQRSEEAGLGSLYDYKARHYSPALGRFLSADTIVPQPGNPQSLNRYAYVLNNPLRYTDPTGYFSQEEQEQYQEWLQQQFGSDWQLYWNAFLSDPYWMWILNTASWGWDIWASSFDSVGTFVMQDGRIMIQQVDPQTGTISHHDLWSWQGQGKYLLRDNEGYTPSDPFLPHDRSFIGAEASGIYTQPVYDWSSGTPRFFGHKDIFLNLEYPPLWLPYPSHWADWWAKVPNWTSAPSFRSVARAWQERRVRELAVDVISSSMKSILWWGGQLHSVLAELWAYEIYSVP